MGKNLVKNALDQLLFWQLVMFLMKKEFQMLILKKLQSVLLSVDNRYTDILIVYHIAVEVELLLFRELSTQFVTQPNKKEWSVKEFRKYHHDMVDIFVDNPIFIHYCIHFDQTFSSSDFPIALKQQFKQRAATLSYKEYEGNSWVKDKIDYFNIPILARENSIIPYGNIDNKPDYDYSDDVMLRVYSLNDNIPAEVTLYDNLGNISLNLTITKNIDKYIIKINKLLNACSILLTSADLNLSCDNADVYRKDNKTIIKIENDDIKELILNSYEN